MKIRPLQGKILLRMDDPQEFSDGGIVIPEANRDKATTGTVMRTGIWRMNKRGCLIPFPAKPGQKVLVSKYRGRTVNHPSKKLKLVDMDDILAIMEA